MVKVWVRAALPGDPGQQDANVIHFFMELDPEEVELLGVDSTKIAAKLIASQNYLTWLFSAQGAHDQEYARTGMPKGSGPAAAQGSTPRKPLDRAALGRRAIKVFEDELARAKAGGNPQTVKRAEDMLKLAKERLVSLSS